MYFQLVIIFLRYFLHELLLYSLPLRIAEQVHQHDLCLIIWRVSTIRNEKVMGRILFPKGLNVDKHIRMLKELLVMIRS